MGKDCIEIHFFGDIFMNGYDDPTTKDTRKVDLLKLRLPDGSVASCFRIWSIF